LHSYYFDAAFPKDIAATVNFPTALTCGVIHDNIYGMQFHPEKSHLNGMTLFKNFEDL